MTTRTYRAEAFMRAAGRLGVEVTVGTEVEQALAPLTAGSYLALDFRHPRVAQRQVLEFARQFPVDALVGLDDDTALLAALAAEALGLPHNSVESVKAARYKDVMRLVLAESGLNTPWFELAAVDEDPQAVAGRVEYPCVVKPLALSASRGVIRADDPAQLAAAFAEAAEVLAEANLPADDPAAGRLLIEAFIPGLEYALEGLLVEGRLTVLALFDKPDPLDGPYFEETLYLTPSCLPAAQQAAIAEAVGRACQQIGLREGPIHAEARLNERGPWVLEVAPRTIGGLCSRTLRFDSDLSLEEIVLRQAARLDLASLEREQRPAGVMMIPIPRGGILCQVQGLEAARQVAGIEDLTITIPRGGQVVPLPRGSQYLGFIFARGDSAAAVEAALREAHRRLSFDIQ
jgi:biotin carboxylase